MTLLIIPVFSELLLSITTDHRRCLRDAISHGVENLLPLVRIFVVINIVPKPSNHYFLLAMVYRCVQI